MAKLIVLYKQPADKNAFTRHYRDTHIPLAKAIPGVRSYEISDGAVMGPAGESDVFLTAILAFDSMTSLQQGLGSPQGQAAVADLANFASAGVDIMMCETRPA